MDTLTLKGTVLREMLDTKMAWDADGERVALKSAISPDSALKLQKLVWRSKPKHTLEIGLAMGVSTLAILYALEKATHTAIDLTQLRKTPFGWNGVGMAMVSKAGLSDKFHAILGERSHTVLPRLLGEGRKFDLVFIDSWHSFDVTFIEAYYADLLLNDGGILVFDDVWLPGVHKVCWFIETHKDYERLGPPLPHPLHPVEKLRRRIGKCGEAMQAYRKRSSTIVPWDFADSEFYSYYGFTKWVRWLRRSKPSSPLLRDQF